MTGAEVMLRAICASVLIGLEGGETEVSVNLRREIPRPDGKTVDIEFVVVRGFKCASETCGRPFHVMVESPIKRYEYPDDFDHGHLRDASAT